MDIIQIDRFEGDFAVCFADNSKQLDINKSDLPPGVKEGDVLVFDSGAYRIDKQETQRRREEIQKLFNQLIN